MIELGDPVHAAESAAFVAHDPSFAAVLGDEPRLVKVADVDAHEGPVYVAGEDALYFTTVRTDRVSIKRLSLEDGAVGVVRDDANTANGMTADREGRLVVCEQGTRTTAAGITRLDLVSGLRETLVDSVDGLPLNSPNDVVVKSDGSVWFTDPSYGFLQGFRPEPQRADAVYRYDPSDGSVIAVAAAFDKPNGLAFSPDERILYVGDNGAPHRLLAFDVGARGVLSSIGSVVAVEAPGHPDGLKIDTAGRIYGSTPTGIHVFSPTGGLIGEIALPGAVNFTFGGEHRNVLFITADTAIFAAVLDARGADRPNL